MEVKQDYSCGVVPVYRTTDGQWEVFLINQIPRKGQLFWTLPKGHPELGETAVETALRELQEETGIVPYELKEDATFVQEYSFVHEGCTIEKKVIYYLGLVDTKDFQLQIEEINDAGWFSFPEATSRITHDIARSLLEEVNKYVNNLRYEDI